MCNAAITTGLAALGGPLGILGGIGVLGLSVLISQSITKYGFEKIYHSTLNKLIEKGETKENIKKKIKKYPISKSLKLKLYDLLDNETEKE